MQKHRIRSPHTQQTSWDALVTGAVAPDRLWSASLSSTCFPPCPSQWQFKLNGSGEMICTCLWLFRNVKCGDTCPPSHSWPWALSVHEGLGLAPTGNVSLESGAKIAQFLRGVVKLVLFFFFFFLNHPIQHRVWCEGKPMHDYILQLSFIYTIKGHVNVSYNWI